MLDHIKDNIIEIAIIYNNLLQADEIIVEDSLDGKHAICELAEEFEELHRGTDWDGESDYYIEIEKFAKENLKDRFPYYLPFF